MVTGWCAMVTGGLVRSGRRVGVRWWQVVDGGEARCALERVRYRETQIGEDTRRRGQGRGRWRAGDE